MSLPHTPVVRQTIPSLDVFLRDITAAAITPLVQPIVDVSTGLPVGHEVLSRGRQPFVSPALLFQRARQLGLTAELEAACHEAALTRISRWAVRHPRMRWFINVTPEILCDADPFVTAARFLAAGVPPSRVVVEITERGAEIDHARLRHAVRKHVEQGFLIALDDFGAGSSGLLALVSTRPSILKLDMELTRDLQDDLYKQKVVGAIVALAASVHAELVAEGVETWRELEALMRIGVRLVQGYLIAKPQLAPGPLDQRVLIGMSRTTAHCAAIDTAARELRPYSL